jgi:hypothetical protein
MLIPFLQGRHITGSHRPRVLELLLSLPMAKTGHMICKQILTAAQLSPMSALSVIAALTAAGCVPCVLVKSPHI